MPLRFPVASTASTTKSAMNLWMLSGRVHLTFSKQSIEGLSQWPASLNSLKTDEILGHEAACHIGDLAYRTKFREMVMKQLTENMM